MADFISYDDNLFFVMAQTKHLQNGLRLTLHRPIFSGFYIKQFNFLADVLRSIQRELFERPQLIKLNDYLQLLRSSQAMFIRLLETFLSHSMFVVDNNRDIAVLKQEMQDNLDQVIDRLSEDDKNITEVDTVSTEEMSILLSSSSEEDVS